MQKIQPNEARYIKLGRGGIYESVCLRDGVLRLGYYAVPNLQGMNPDELRKAAQDACEQAYGDEGQGSVTNHTRQVADFHLCQENTLWVTFAQGRLWWCFARPEVEYFGEDRERFPEGSRQRKAIGGWHETNINGRPLVSEELDGRLTQTGAYQGTICGIGRREFAYLTRVINDEPHPDVEEAQRRRAAVLESVVMLTRSLHPKTFELLVDLVFSQSGWRRVSPIGGSQKTIDLLLELPSTGEKAFVQVKSQTNRPQFENYVSQLEGRGEDRMFYVYHTGPELSGPDKVTVINAERLAEMILNAGLVDWLIRRSGF